MLRHVARQPGDFGREFAQLAPQRRVHPLGEPGQELELLAERPGRAVLGEARHLLELARREVERLADLPHGRPQAIGGERAHQPDVVVPVALVDAADQLLADLAREVQVDVGDRGEGLVQEPPDEEPGRHGVDVRQAEQVAHDGRHRGAAAAARQQVAGGAAAAAPHVGPHLPGQLEQVVVDEEEATESMVFDECQLCGQPSLGLGAVL